MSEISFKEGMELIADYCETRGNCKDCYLYSGGAPSCDINYSNNHKIILAALEVLKKEKETEKQCAEKSKFGKIEEMPSVCPSDKQLYIMHEKINQLVGVVNKLTENEEGKK